MKRSICRDGATLPELIVCLLVLGMVVQVAFPPVRRQADALVVRGVREEVVALLHRARMEARLHGEARLLLEQGGDAALMLPGERPPAIVPLIARGVELDIVGSRESVELTYGPLGTARFASATFVLRRRDSETSLVVSGYGRVRR